MTTGMLWFDNDPKTGLGDKIKKAAAYYQAKYGQAPNAAQVNPAGMDESVKVEGIQIRGDGYVLPNHIWMGVEVQHG